MFDQLGPYRIERVLGRGGMGMVYAGQNETGQRAAIKVLQPNLADDDSFRERFQAEIESLKKLRHPRIVQLYGYGEHDGQLFYAMELVDGGSLQEELMHGRHFPWREVTRFAIDICQALKHAHDHGVIHRDLKPANLLLDRDDHVKLTDFGIAKLFGTRSQTLHGGVLGTADYMAPEQAEGRSITPRCDLYSLGCVMFALLAGHPPFRGKTMAEVVHQLRYAEPPRVRNFCRDIPAALDEAIDMLLRKDPLQRVPTALALANRLQALERSLTVLDEREADGPAPAAGVRPHEAPLSQIIDPELATRPTAPMLHDVAPTPDPLPPLIAPAEAVPPSPVRSPDRSPENNGTRFTTVDTIDRQADTANEAQEPSPWLLVFCSTVAVLLALTAGIYYQLRIPSADALYLLIMEAADKENWQSLQPVSDRIDQFMQNYPDDPRSPEIVALYEELEVGLLKRKLEDKSHRRKGAQSMTAVERAYLEAIRHLEDQPEVAATRLKSLIGLFSGAAFESLDSARCLRLAREQLQTLEQQLGDRSKKDLPVLKTRLQDALNLDESNPALARTIRESLVLLYGDKPWAADVVAEANAQLRSAHSSDHSAAPSATPSAADAAVNSDAEVNSDAAVSSEAAVSSGAEGIDLTPSDP